MDLGSLFGGPCIYFHPSVYFVFSYIYRQFIINRQTPPFPSKLILFIKKNMILRLNELAQMRLFSMFNRI